MTDRIRKAPEGTEEAKIADEYTCKECGEVFADWEPRAPNDAEIKCPNGHLIPGTLGDLRNKVTALGLKRFREALRRGG